VARRFALLLRQRQRSLVGPGRSALIQPVCCGAGNDGRRVSAASRAARPGRGWSGSSRSPASTPRAVARGWPRARSRRS